MSRRKEEVLVLEVAPYGDTSRRVVVLGRDSGTFGLIQRGGKQAKKGFPSGGMIDRFAHLEIDYKPARGEGLGGLYGSSLVDVRLDMQRHHLVGLCGGLLAELIARAEVPDGDEAAKIFILLKAVWDDMERALHPDEQEEGRAANDGRGRVDYREVLDSLGMGWAALLQALGSAPVWDVCPTSGEALPPALSGSLTGRVDLADGGRLAKGAMIKQTNRPMTAPTEIAVGRWLLSESALPSLANQPLPPQEHMQLEGPLNFLAVWTRYHLEIKLRSFDSLRKRVFSNK